MGFNRRKMKDQRRQAAEKEAAARRATDAQILEDAERLIAAIGIILFNANRWDGKIFFSFEPQCLMIGEKECLMKTKLRYSGDCRP
jgi:hypothetical protein